VTKVPVKSLRFGAYEVKVKHLAKEDAKENWGLYYPQKYEMHLCDDFPNSQKAAEVALHECLHVIWQERGLKKGDQEEAIVTELALGILGFLRSNPRFTKWLIKAIA
jgi:hypothetical protein